MAGAASQKHPDSEASPYLSPRELTTRWRCSRATVDNISRRAGFTRVCLGEGRNGIVRFLRKEVEAYEQQRSIGGN